jgi:hypothetical protein
MDRIRGLWRRRPSVLYERIGGDSLASSEITVASSSVAPFSWLEYAVFFIQGISMLWAWYVPADADGGCC